ncbi:MAG: hypothetical protein QNI96_02850 [Woeseiaceae bacterium]|nr:hypothetical protein [Woeseiaceae bacterium]
MTDDRDPGLQALFDAAPRAAGNSDFVARVMADIDSMRRRTVAGWAVAILVLAPVAWWLSAPVMGAVNLATRLMPESLVTIESAWMEQLLAPINSFAGAAGMIFLGVWWFYRKIFR